MITDEESWPDERGLWRDGRGRIRSGFCLTGSYHVSSDDSLEALEEAIIRNNDEMTTRELMYREVGRKKSGSHGRKRSPKAKPVWDRMRAEDDDGSAVRVGRPLIGAEVRVPFHTSIAQRTRTMLIEGGVTLAEVFDASARRLNARGE